MQFNNIIMDMFASKKSADEVRVLFENSLAEAISTYEAMAYTRGTHALPQEMFDRLDCNETTLEDALTILAAVLYRDYPDLREALEEEDIETLADTVHKTIEGTANMVQSLSKMWSNQQEASAVSTPIKQDYQVFKDFFKTLGI